MRANSINKEAQLFSGKKNSPDFFTLISYNAAKFLIVPKYPLPVSFLSQYVICEQLYGQLTHFFRLWGVDLEVFEKFRIFKRNYLVLRRFLYSKEQAREEEQQMLEAITSLLTKSKARRSAKVTACNSFPLIFLKILL